MTRLPLAIALASLCLAGPALAQERPSRNVDAQPGKQVRLIMEGNVGQDCKPGAPVEIKVVTQPRNGSLVVRAGETPVGLLKRCPSLKVPVQAVFYQAKAGFSGSDEVSFEIKREGKVQTQTVRITVTDKPKAEPKEDGANL